MAHQEQGSSFISMFQNETNDPGGRLSMARSSLLGAVNIIIICMAVLGNGLVITVMLFRRRVFLSFTNHLILHQSVTDLIASMVFACQTVIWGGTQAVPVAGNYNIHNEQLVFYTGVLLWCVNVTSTYNLVIISLERFMAVCYPVKHRNACSKDKLKSFAVIATWVIGFVYGSHLAFVFTAEQGCCQVVDMDLGLKIFVGTVTLGIEFLVPIVIMIYAYSRILIMLTKKLANLRNARQNSLREAKKSVTMTLLLMSIMFFVCWTPVEIVYLLTLLTSPTSRDRVLQIAVSALLSCNMCVNPIIYAVKYRFFRLQLKHLVLKITRRNRVRDGQPVTVAVLSH